jgi:hypothetical protein
METVSVTKLAPAARLYAAEVRAHHDNWMKANCQNCGEMECKSKGLIP